MKFTFLIIILIFLGLRIIPVGFKNQGVKILNTQSTINNFYAFKQDYNKNQALINHLSLPNGYRLRGEENSYANWLIHLPIKKDNIVYLFNGEKKYNQNAQYKVLDIDVGNKDLQQCADAVMRLRAEYLYSNKKYEKIHFNYTNGLEIGFKKWSMGYYPALKGNKINWVSSPKNNSTHGSFRKYMNNIFTYAGTSSLEKELLPINLKDIKAGDVFIKGGFPGHAVIVLAVAESKTKNDKCFILAQSYMPAQNIHVLKNPNNNNLNPWYSIKECLNIIKTPEWTFYPNQLKRFRE